MIKLKNIKLRFNDRIIFDDFDLQIDEGEKILLDAPSGKGKSTLIKILLGFTRLDSGEIYYMDKLVSEKNINNFRSQIAYISQDVELRDIILSDLIEEIFTYKHNKELTYDINKLLELFQQFHLNCELLNKKTSKLSGGERQRVGLVLALLLERKILLLDEITSGLENDLKEEIVNYIYSLDQTVIVISHDLVWQSHDGFRRVRW